MTTTTRVNEPLPEELVRVLRTARSVTVLTGAGVSAESGIPTFRDAQTGLWTKFDPMTLASPQGFQEHPDTVWCWYQWRRRLIAENRPNAGHEALARMEPCFEQFTLVTQNVDGFHSLAGSRRVLELHGNIQRNICSRTGRAIHPEWIEQHADAEPPPSPHHAEGLARPDVVWFGEALNADTLNAAFDAAARCELMIVAGTAGAVQPAASIPLLARDGGAKLIDINPEVSELNVLVDWHLSGPSTHWLPELADKLERSG